MADCFEEQSVADLPVLRDNGRFRKFLSEYSLLRFQKDDYKQGLRDWMNRDERMKRMVKQEDGGGIECVLREMREMNVKRFNQERSFLSKLAAFARPEVFIAYDRFAKHGVATLLGQEVPQDYVDYLGKVRQFCRETSVSEEIAGYIADRNIPASNKKAFQLRMLDVYLMLKGCRWNVH